MSVRVERMLFIDQPFDKVYLVIGTALRNIGAEIKYVDQTCGKFTASRGASFTSWGETITIQPFNTPKGCSLHIISVCSLPTQIVDWGKNQDNIDRFAAELSFLLRVPVY